MRKLIEKIYQAINNLFEANLNKEHYWFFPKMLVVPIQKEKKQGKY